MNTLPSCTICGETMENNIVEFLSSWGAYEVKLTSVPAMHCSNDDEIIFEFDIAEFIQELTILLKEMDGDISSLDMKNIFEELDVNEKRYIFLECYSKNKIQPLKSDEGAYYFNKIDLKALNRFTQKKSTFEEIKLAARDAKVSENDQKIIIDRLKDDSNDSENRNR